jgi:hypothetical protein
MADDAQRPGQPFLYDAFISYRHVDRDRKWAEWLIDALERYHVPKSLQHRGLPPRLHKVFRDEDEVPASSDLNDQIREALIASRFLIVVCSAFTPRSKWVEREIQIFNELGRGDQVLALLTEGEPGDSFPAAMLERHREVIDPDGSKRIVKEDKEPLAADVRPRPGVSNEKLKRFALLRLIAVILGVKFDELRQRDHERERHGRLVWGATAAALCLVLGGLGLFYWDRMRPSTAHYRQIVWRWGVPEGLGPIDDEKRRHLATNYSVTTQRSTIWSSPRVVEARRENSAGALRDLSSQRNDNDGRVHWVVRYREDGSVERIAGFDATDRFLRDDVLQREPSSGRLIVTFERNNAPVAQIANQNMIIDPLNVVKNDPLDGRSEITRQELTFDSNGFVGELRFQDNWGTPRHDAEGSFGEHFTNSPEGLVLRTAEIDAAGTEITLKNGVRAVEAVYNQDYNLARYTLTGIDERPIDGPNLFAYYVRQFDRWGNDLSTTYYHPDGKVALTKDGYAAYVAPRDDRGFQTGLSYLGLDGKPTLDKKVGFASFKGVNDDRGNDIEVSFFGIDGTPTLLGYGCAIVRLAFDQRGNVIQQSFFGVDGKPTLIKDGYAEFRQAFDERGNRIERKYFGTDGDPTLSNEGIAKVIYNYDARGNEIMRAFFDVAGKSVLMKNGYAGFRQAFDERGNRIEMDWFGTNGSPILNNEGFAKATFNYDAHGNETNRAYFGVDGKPALGTDGYAEFRQAFDDRGNRIELDYFGTDGNPTVSNEGLAKAIYSYDARGNEIKHAFFDVDGKPTQIKDGTAGFQQAFDDRGNRIEMDWFGTNGNPILNNEGVAKVIYNYDPRGNEVGRAFFGVDGKSTLINAGYASYRQAFDERGNRIELDFFGADGNPTLNNEGIARITYNYDTRGNEVRRAFFGVDGKSTLINVGYASSRQAFDERGNRIELDYFGTDGKPIVIPMGFAKIAYSFDDVGREIRATYFDAQGREISMQVVVRSVMKGTTAERIGLVPGDRILSYDGKRLSSVTQLVDMVTDASGATRRRLVIRRGSEELSFEVGAGRLGINTEMARADSDEVKNPRAQAN